MIKIHIIAYLLTIVGLVACVGTDEINDGTPQEVETNEKLAINPMRAALRPEESLVFKATFINKEGIEEIIFPNWSSSDTAVAHINDAGVAFAKKPGIVTISASTKGITTEAELAVIDDSNRVAQLYLSFDNCELALGSTKQLSARALNINGVELTGKQITFSGTNEASIQVSPSGLLTAVAQGQAQIKASAEGVSSLVKTFYVGENGLKGTFSGSNGYNVQGNARLYYDCAQNLILELKDDFTVSSFGAAIYVYLTNSASSVAGGVEIQQLSKTGLQTFNLSAINPSINFNTYSHVVIHCKPFNVPFGSAQLK